MATLDKTQVMVGTLDQASTIGAALWGPLTATLPTVATMDVTTGYTGLGYLEEDGFTLSFGITTVAIKEHNLSTVRELISEFDGHLTLRLIQTSADIMEVIVGDDHVTTAAATTTLGNRFSAAFGPHLPDPGVLQVRLKDGDRRAVVLFPCAQLVNYSEITIAATDAIGWELDFKALDDGTGESIYILHDDGKVTA